MDERRGKVLVTDDERGAREAVRFALKDFFDLVFAENGEEAVRCIQEDPDVEVVILDILMPLKGGFQALEEIKAIREDVQVLILTAHDKVDYAIRAMKYGAYDYLIKPFNASELPEMVRAGIRKRDKIVLARASVQRFEDITRRLREHYLDTARGLVQLVNERDGYAERNSVRIACLVQAIAESLGIPESAHPSLMQMGVLRDLGKIGVEEQILRKPGALSDEERELVYSHPSLSAVILGAVRFLRDFLPYVELHHERYDGSGYPMGLKGENIPREASIICLADAYEAMASERPYRKPLSHEEIAEEIARCSGTQFDPDVVEAFLRTTDLPDRLRTVEERIDREGAEKVLTEILQGSSTGTQAS